MALPHAPAAESAQNAPFLPLGGGLGPPSPPPAKPAEGAVAANAVGAARKITFRFVGNGVLKVVKLAHNQNTRLIGAIVTERAEGGEPVETIEGYAKGLTIVSPNECTVEYTAAPAAGVEFFITLTL